MGALFSLSLPRFLILNFMKRFYTLLLLTVLMGVGPRVFAQYDGKHEWRAVWIATVGNMDWPSSKNLSTEAQKAEIIAYLDLFKQLNFNAIVFQIRPTADAFYASSLEPWSLYLTGKQGLAPEPFYDPLRFVLEESHKRGMEVHAWLNPYRVTQDNANLSETDPAHIFNRHPEWFVKQGRKTYFDPALPETRNFICQVVADILRRYDVDGIHMDDYFYPGVEFNDEASFAKYSRGYTAEQKGDWRRDNVDLVIQQLRDTVKAIKPFVKFGISPYAVWRNLRDDPRGSDSQSYNYTNYDHLYADVLKWMEEGWIDYMLPQFYFHIGYPRADFITLADWWRDNRAQTVMYAGLGTFKLNAEAKDPEWRSADEILKQIDYIRSQNDYDGLCYFNAHNFKVNLLGINEAVAQRQAHPALVPALPGFSTLPPLAPQEVRAVLQKDGIALYWEKSSLLAQAPEAMYWAVYRFPKGSKPDFSQGSAIIWMGGENHCFCPVDAPKDYDYYLTALDRLFNESLPAKALL